MKENNRAKEAAVAAEDIETYHQDGAWYNRVEGEKGSNGPFTSKEEAIAAGRDEAHRAKRDHRH